MDIINDQGVIQRVENVTVVGTETYVGFFIPPTEEFKVQVSGSDDNGFKFSYISDVSVEPTTISLQIRGKKIMHVLHMYVCIYFWCFTWKDTCITVLYTYAMKCELVHSYSTTVVRYAVIKWKGSYT